MFFTGIENWLFDNPWAIWLTIAGMLIIIEFFTTDLTALLLGIASTGAAAAAGLNLPVYVQLIVFIIIATPLLVFARPPLKHLLEGKGDDYHTSFERVIGKTVESISEDRVKILSGNIAGEIWSGRLETNIPLEIGKRYLVNKVEGSTLLLDEIVKEES